MQVREKAQGTFHYTHTHILEGPGHLPLHTHTHTLEGPGHLPPLEVLDVGVLDEIHLCDMR